MCDQEWKDKGYKGSSHGPIAKPRFEKLSNDPKYLLVLAGAARIGGFRGHGKKILPGDVLSAVTAAMENYRRNLDGGHSGAVGAGAPKLCSATSTEQVLSETQGAGECIGGGGLGLWCRGRNGRKAPSSLTKLEYLDRECALDALVNDADERPAPIESAARRTPLKGLGEFFKFMPASQEELQQEAVAAWIEVAPVMGEDLRGQGPAVYSYVRALASALLLAEVPDPIHSDLTPETAWSCVRSRVLDYAMLSTDAATAEWALSRCAKSARQESRRSGAGEARDGAVEANGALGRERERMTKPRFGKKGGLCDIVILDRTWHLVDHGEMLKVGKDEPERAKCLYLSVAHALGVDADKLVSSMRASARAFLSAVPAPKPGVKVPTAILFAFELAHDLLSRDHPQMRSALVWFAADFLADYHLGFVCRVPGGDLRVEFMHGRDADGDSPCGFVACAEHHATSAKPSGYDDFEIVAWELKVLAETGIAPQHWYMTGYEVLLRALENSRFQLDMLDASSLFLCEQCPSAVAPRVRLHQRRCVGAAARGADGEGAPPRADPLMVMVGHTALAPMVSMSRIELARMSAGREAAFQSAARSVLAGTQLEGAADSACGGSAPAAPARVFFSPKLCGAAGEQSGVLRPSWRSASSVGEQKSEYGAAAAVGARKWDVSNRGQPSGASAHERVVAELERAREELEALERSLGLGGLSDEFLFASDGMPELTESETSESEDEVEIGTRQWRRRRQRDLRRRDRRRDRDSSRGADARSTSASAHVGAPTPPADPERVKEVARLAEEFDAKPWSLAAAAEELVELWTMFPFDADEAAVAVRIGLIEHISNRMMRDCGDHEAVASRYREAFVRKFGDHMDAERVARALEGVPGVSDEVKAVLIKVARDGVDVEERAPRWDLRLRMNAELAAEHGMQAVEKVIKDGRAGRIMILSSLVEKELLSDEHRVMVARFIRVAKRFLSGAVNPADARWCNAQLDANKITPKDGIGPGGGVQLPTQKMLTIMVLRLAMTKPGLLMFYSKQDVNEAFRLIWLAIKLIGLFAVSIPRWVLGLGQGHFYIFLLALSFGSAISPGFFDYFSKAISAVLSSYSPPNPWRDGVLQYLNLMLVDDIVCVGVLEGFALLWCSMVCQWAMRMLLGISAVNEIKGFEEAQWEQRKINWGILHDASTVHLDPLSLRLQVTPVKREKAKELVFNPLFDHGSYSFGRWQVQVLSGNVVFWATVAPVMWPILMSLAGVTSLLPEGIEGLSDAPSADEKYAYQRVWDTVELLRCIVGSTFWWDAAFSGSVASTFSLRERLRFAGSEDSLVWVGGDANMIGVAAGSWSDEVYAIVRTADWEKKLKRVWSDELGELNVTEDELIVAIWEFLCYFMIMAVCAYRWTNKIVVYVSDNMLVVHWLTNNRARNKLANFFCGLNTLSMARNRFETYAVCIDTDHNDWDIPSRVHDPDEVRKGPGLDGIDAYMEETFPGLVQIDVSEQLDYYLQEGAVRQAYELYGAPDPVARSLALARHAPSQATLASRLVVVGLYSGILALEREVALRGGTIRAVGEWSPASRAVSRLDVGDVEFFADVLSEEHKCVDERDVEGALASPACVDYSTAGSQRGLNGRRGWQAVDCPRTFLHFQFLLTTLVENVYGWITAHGGQSFQFYVVAMGRLKHVVHAPWRLDSKFLSQGIQSERAMVLSNRKEFHPKLGAPRALGEVRRAAVPMKRYLLTAAEVGRRRFECEILAREGSWIPARVGQREYGPVRLGTIEFKSTDEQGNPVAGAMVRMADSKDVWRVVAVVAENVGGNRIVRYKLRCGMLVKFKSLDLPGGLARVKAGKAKPDEVDRLEPLTLSVYSIDGQAFRITSSDVAEPPLRQSKAVYWDPRLNIYRILLPEEGWLLMGKPREVLSRWRTRYVEEQANVSLPKTVPPYTPKYIWGIAGNSIVQKMAALAVDEYVSRYCRMKALLISGEVELEPGLPSKPDDLYDAPALEWRRKTFAAEVFQARPPETCGIDDSHLDVTKRPAEKRHALSDEEALGYLHACASGALSADSFAGERDERVEGDAREGESEFAKASRSADLSEHTESRYELDMRVEYGGASERLLQDLIVHDAAARKFWGPGGVAVGAPKRTSHEPRRSSRESQPRRAFRPAATFKGRNDGPVDCEDDPAMPPLTAEDSDDEDEPPPAKPKKSQVTLAVKGAKVRRGAAPAQPKARAAKTKTARAKKPDTGDIPRPDFGKLESQVRNADVFGPIAKPKVTAKDKRRRGIALAALEMRSMFDKGDWNAIEEYAVHRLPMYSVAWSTLKGYESAWKHWVSFQYRAQLPIFMLTGTAFERSLCTKWMLSFVALLAYGVGYAPSTIKKCLMAIRFFHLAHDYENPLEKCPRVWQGYKAYKRMYGPTIRKYPITPEMMDWLDKVTSNQGLLGVIRRARVKFGTYLGTRSSETMGPDVHWDKIVTTDDIRPMKDEAYCTWRDVFTGVMVRFRGSKTDQYNQGCMRYVGQTGNARCLIRELHEWYKLQPDHFEGVRSEARPFFTMPDGKVATRQGLQADLRAAAVACGVDESRVGTHSLRVSCATWLYQAGYDLEYIKRHGRWVSNVAHVYLWEGSGFHDMAKRMSETKFVLHAML
ncbi:MAG: hypothetical protein CL861_00440 [Cyanobium sp. MED843]|nr:hypothetical protein [Cyanobium sp. MED843]